MAIERTLCIVKPDAVEKNNAPAILGQLQKEGFEIIEQKRVHLTKPQAEGFYAVHRARPFFGELVTFMTRSPAVMAVLQRENAVAKYREVMGATDPAKADAGTIRKLFGSNVGENAVHCSPLSHGALVPGVEILLIADPQ